MKDKFDKEFGNIDWDSDSELTENTRKTKIKNSWNKFRKEKQGEIAKKVSKKESWLKKVGDNNRKMAKDPDWINKVKKSIKNKYDTDPEYKKKKLEFMQSDSFNEKRKKGHAKWHEENKEEFAKIVSKARRSGKGMREIVTPYGEFKTIVEFHEHINKPDDPTLFFRKKNAMPHLYYYKEDGPGKEKYETVFHSPYGKAGKKHRQRLIEERAIQAKDEVFFSYKRASDWWARMKYLHPEEYYETREVKIEWDLIN